MSEPIGFFIREEPYGFLSNFERTPFTVDGLVYATNEHFYQSRKAWMHPEIAEYIRNAPTARIVMILGRDIEHNKYLKKYMRDDWGDVTKRSIMLRGLRAKFEHPKLRKMLLDTGDAILFENNPEDPYWAIGPDGKGKSWLGKLLMQVRDEIRESNVLEGRP